MNSRLSDLTSRLSHIESSRASPDITISGIPASATDSPRTMVLKVFEALGIPELAVDVLEIRSLAEGNASMIGDPQRRSAAAGSTLSFIVTLKSSGIRDHIISRKRAKGNLTVNQVFALDQPGSVFVREFLPSTCQLSTGCCVALRLQLPDGATSTFGLGLVKSVFASRMELVSSSSDLI